MQTIGERIKEVRKANNLTQVELGRVIGISGSGISQIESNVSKPTEAAIKLICATYHINYLWLTEGAGPMMQEETAEDMIERILAGESPLTISIMKAFARLPDAEWQKLRDIIEFVKKNGPL